ncbi:hypothetical protein P4H94_29965, partial [Paenibacillus macerans]|uniref:hypothetical protein n=1 Tax=Paenibacillus macerans TaxID=44252 RepID=UPI002DBF4D80
GWGLITVLSFFPASCPIPPSGLFHFSNLLLTSLSNDLEINDLELTISNMPAAPKPFFFS